MRWLLRIVVTLILVVVILAGVGFLLPSRYHVERSVEIGAPSAKVYALLVDPHEWKRWTIWNQRDPGMKVEYAGPQSGAGAKWSWESKTEGTGNMEFTEVRQDELVAYKLNFPDFGMQSGGALTLTPSAGAAGKVRVRWTNDGELGLNPMSRWFGLMMDRLVGPDFDAGLGNLKRLAEAG
jgi:uncharacterized protein YndB with AHSA1/START domain